MKPTRKYLCWSRLRREDSSVDVLAPHKYGFLPGWVSAGAFDEGGAMSCGYSVQEVESWIEERMRYERSRMETRSGRSLEDYRWNVLVL